MDSLSLVASPARENLALVLGKLNPTTVLHINAGGIHRKIWSFFQVARGSLHDLKVKRQCATVWINDGEGVFHMSYCTNEGSQVVMSLPFSALNQAVEDLRDAGF